MIKIYTEKGRIIGLTSFFWVGRIVNQPTVNVPIDLNFCFRRNQYIKIFNAIRSCILYKKYGNIE